MLTAGCAQQQSLDVRSSAAVVSVAAAPTCTNAGVLAGWSVRRLAKQTLVVPVDETAVTRVTPEVAAGIGGIILFGNRAPAGLGSTLAAVRAKAPGGIPPLVMTDEEGGAVQRMANVVGAMPSARVMGATMTPTGIRALARHAGALMRRAGVTMDLAPVLDLDGGAGPNSRDAIGTRSFSTDPKTAAADGLAFAGGLREAGVVPVVKHFPGLGGASRNTDVGPAATPPWTSVRAHGLLPFRSAVRAKIPAIMVSNASVPGLTPRPASLSPAVITGVLRTDLQFRGLVVTDSLSAGAVSGAGYTVPRAAVTALTAGADLLLYNASPATVHTLTTRITDAIVAAVASGGLHAVRLQNAVRHVLAAKRIDLCA
jgi:beta-N-acetylhexosaminidase